MIEGRYDIIQHVPVPSLYECDGDYKKLSCPELQGKYTWEANFFSDIRGYPFYYLTEITKPCIDIKLMKRKERRK